MSSNLIHRKEECVCVSNCVAEVKINHKQKFITRVATTLVALLVMGVGVGLGQTTFSWRGEASNGNWNDANNWWNGSSASTAGFGILFFDNANQTSMTNNFSSTFNTFALRFNNSTARTIGGTTAFRLFDNSGTDPFIENATTATHVINTPLEGDGNSADPLLININNTGGFTFGGTVNNQGSTINIIGARSTSGSDVTFSNVISGSGGLYKENSNIIANLSANNIYSGQTTIQAGTLRLSGSGSIPNSDVRIYSNGILDIRNSATVKSVAEHASSNSGTISIGSGATLTIAGGWGETTLYQNSISGSGGLTKNGTGTLVLFGTQSYTGSTSVSGGKLSTGFSIACTDYHVSGGTLEFTAANIIPNTANFNVTGGTVLFIENETINNLTATSGTITVAAGKTLTILGKLSMGSGVTISGTIAYGNGADLELTGGVTTTDLLWPSSGGPSDIIVNASGSTVSLHGTRTVAGTLTLTAGKLALANYNLTVGAITGGGVSSYVQTSGTGTLTVNGINNGSGVLIPVGNSTYNPITVANTSSNNWTVKVTDAISAPAPFNTNANSAIQRTWSITPSTNPTTSTNITLQFDDTDLSQKPNGFDVNSQVQAFKRNTTNWMRVGTASTLGGSSGARTFTITGVTSFSDFGLTNVGSPLPVTFTSLTGSIRSGRAQLSWNIADEVNVDHYEVEESADGRRFQALTQVDAASRSSYQANDAQLNLGANYYRVKAVDIDGKLTYSKIIRLENGSVDQQIRVYPNPSQGELTLGLNIAAGSYQIRVINAVGQTVHQQSLTHEGGSRSLPLALPKLNAGIYQVEVRGGVQKHVRTVRIE